LFAKLNEATPKTDFASQEEARKMANDALDCVNLDEFIVKTIFPISACLKPGTSTKIILIG